MDTERGAIRFVLERAPEDEPPRCRLRPSPRSMARCENYEGHDDDPWHMGRTRGGYWKIWRKSDTEALPVRASHPAA